VKALRSVMVSAVIVAMVVGVATNHLSTLAPWMQPAAFALVIVALILWVGSEAGSFLIAVLYGGKGRYSVLVFALDRQKRLLLVQHPFHKRRIPPGGRLKMFELPHDAVGRLLKEEAGVTSYEFSSQFHRAEGPYTDFVTVLPQPYRVQRELRDQRGWVKFHYAFVYVVRTDDALGAVLDYDPRWYTAAEVHAMVPPTRPFDDIVLRYDDILKCLQPEPVRAHG
jgi:ADP-ribose pyrophosphatase YjhB (NUDIX family)